MFKKFYFKFILFSIILLLLAVIIDAKNNRVDLPIIHGRDINFEEKVSAKVSDEYLIYVSDFNNLIFPINIIANKSYNFKMSYYNNKVETKFDEQIYMTFSLLTNYSNYLPTRVTTKIPPSTQLVSYKLENKTLTLNLSNEFLNYNENNEKEIIKIITYTFTNFDNVDKVKLLCNDELVKFKTTAKSEFTRKDFALNVYLKDAQLNEGNYYNVYYYIQIEDNMYLVPVTMYDTTINNSTEETVVKLITNTYNLPVISLLSIYDINEYRTNAFFEDDLELYQYYFTFYDNNIIIKQNNLSIKQVNFYEIEFSN